MFSIITMASSTTKPVEIVSAISVKLFRLYPSRYMTANVPTIDSGTATLGMIVARKISQEKKDHHHHQADGELSSNSTSLTEARMVSVRSVRTETLHRRRKRGLQLRQELLDLVGNADDVRARLPLNIHDDRGGKRDSLPHPCGLLRVLNAVGDWLRRPQPYRRAVAVCDNDRFVFSPGASN